MERQRGTVKWFSREKGWGFIRLDSGEEIFVHHSDIQGEGFVSLEDDQPVEFVIEQMEKGPRARQVRELGAAAPREADDGPSGETAVSARQTGRGGRHERGERHAEVSGTRPGAESGSETAASGASSDHGERRTPLAEQLRRRLGSLFPGLDG